MKPSKALTKKQRDECLMSATKSLQALMDMEETKDLLKDFSIITKEHNRDTYELLIGKEGLIKQKSYIFTTLGFFREDDKEERCVEREQIFRHGFTDIIIFFDLNCDEVNSVIEKIK